MSRDTLNEWTERQKPGDKPRVMIIGAGVSGIATGSYAQMNGMDSRIFEAYVLPGGCCTAWTRKGYVFDYCIEWLIGSGKGNGANQVWQELGALDGKRVTDFEMFNRVVDVDGRSVTFYNDPDQLERHLLEVSPVDAPLIRVFCADLRRFLRLDLYPFLKPKSLHSWREKLAMLMEILPSFRLFWRNGATQMDSFADRFQDPFLRRAFRNIFFQDPQGFPLMPYLYSMACAHKGNAGFPQGGSLGLARSIEERYFALGGKIRYRSRVQQILVEEGRAVGIELKDGSRHYADYVVSACDGRTTIYDMLGGRYVNATIDKLYQEMLHRPGILYSGVVSAFIGLRGEVDLGGPHSTTYLLSDEEASHLPGSSQRSLVVQLRSRYCGDLAPPGCSIIHCTYFSDFNYWSHLRSQHRQQYWAEKRAIVEFVRAYLERLYPGVSERIEVTNVSTPATTQRYTGNYAGSILAWKAFTDAEDLTEKLVNEQRMQLPGLRNFYMVGQWINGGGLIRAAASGRFVAQYLCQDEGRTFTAWPSTNAVAWDRSKLILPATERESETEREPALELSAG